MRHHNNTLSEQGSSKSQDGQISRNVNLTFYRPNVICFIQGISPYRAVKIFHHDYKNRSFSDV